MFVLFLCGAPWPFSDEPVDLSVAGATVTKSFTAPVDISYALAVTFEFPSVEARLNDQIVGDRFSEDCLGNVRFGASRYEEIQEIKRIGLGLPIPFKVVIRKLTDRSVIVDQTFQSLCISSSNGESEKTRDIAWLQLPIGDNLVEVTSVQV